MKSYIKKNFRGIIVIIFLIIVYKTDFSALFNKILSVMYPVITGLLFARILIPIKKYTERILIKTQKKVLKKYASEISAVTVYILFLLVIFFFLIYLVPIIKNGITECYEKGCVYYKTAEKYINGDIDDIIKKIINITDTKFYIKSAKGTFAVIFNFIMSPVVLIYVLLEHKSLKKSASEFSEFVLGQERAEKLLFYISNTDKIFTNYFYGKAVSSLMLGVLVTAGFYIAKLNYPIFLGTLVALSNLIPVFGAIINAVPVILCALSEYGIKKAVTAAIILFLGQQIENNILTPKIVGNSMGMSGFWVLFSAIFGGGLFGFWGMLVCIPVAATIKMLFSEFKNKKKGLKKSGLSV